MYDLYTWGTPNGRKVSILLEELGVPYAVHPVDIGDEAQFAPEFLKISPNNKIPALVDRETGRSVMESGAILLYLADKHAAFLPPDRWEGMEWLMWQMAGLGPMLGQVHHFVKFNPGQAPYAEERYAAEARRLYGVLDRRLEGRPFVCDAYSVVDMACWPWISRFEWQQIDLHDFPRVRDWYLRVAERPAVQRGYHVPAHLNDIPLPPPAPSRSRPMTDHAPRDRVERWVDLPARAEDVWAAVGPFGALADWHPTVTECQVVKIDGETHRHVTLKDGEMLLEKLLAEEPHTLRYAMVDGPLPVSDYRATLTCFPEGEGSRLFWSASYETDEPEVDGLVSGLFEAGLRAVRDRFPG